MPILDLTFDADLINVLDQVVPTIDKRIQRTPEQRSIELQILGTNHNLVTLDAVERELKLLKTAKNVDELSVRMSALRTRLDPDEYSTLARHGFDAVERATSSATMTQGEITGTVAAITSAQTSIAKARSAHKADAAEFQARLRSADAASAQRQTPALKAFAKLKQEISPDGQRKLKAHYKQLAARLATAETALTTLQNAASPQGKAVTDAAAKVARRRQRLLAADPDRIIAQRIQDLADKLPLHSDERTLLMGVGREVRLAALDREVVAREQQLIGSLPELQRAAGSINRQISISVGAQWGTLGKLTKISSNVGYGFSVEMRRLSNGTYQARVANALSIGGTASVGSTDATHAGVSAELEASASQWRTYNSLKDLAVAEGDYMMTLAIGRGNSDAKAARKYLKDRRQLAVQADADRRSLAEHVERVYAEQPDTDLADREFVTIKARDIAPIERVLTRRKAVTAQVNATLRLLELDFTTDGDKNTDDSELPGKIALEAAVSLSHVRSQDFTAVSYLDDLLGSADAQAIEAMKHPAAMRRVNANGELRSSEQTTQYYDTVRSHLQTLKSLASDESRDAAAGLVSQEDARAAVRETQRGLSTDMERLAGEYDLFVELHNRRSRGDLDPGGHVEATYKRLLTERGITDTKIGPSNKAARYIKAMSLQFAVLNDLRKTSEKIVASNDADFLQFRNRFEHALRVPHIALTEKQRRLAFGDEAASDVTTINTWSVAMGASYSAGLAHSGDQIDSKVAETLGKFSGVSGSLAASYTRSTTTTPGSPSSTSVLIDVDFSLGSLGGDVHRTEEVNPNFSRELAGSMAAKLLDRRALRGLFKTEPGGHEAALAELTDALLAVATDQAGRLQVKYDVVGHGPAGGKLRLRTVATVKNSQTALSIGAVIPTAAALNATVNVSQTQTKSVQSAVYHGSNTLSGLTDAHRIRRPTNVATGQEWDHFASQSGLLQRLMKTVADAAKSKTEGGDDLAAVLANVKAGTLDPNQPASWKLEPDSVANELVPWLLALKAGPEDREPDQAAVARAAADSAAADAFVDGYVSKQRLLEDPTTSASDRATAIDAMAGLLDSVVARKRSNEDHASNKRFVAQRRMSRSEINGHVAARLAEKFSELDLRVERALNPTGAEDSTNRFLTSPDSLSRMKRRVVAAYHDQPNEKTFTLVRDVMSLEHAVESLDDLTQFDNRRDKERALAQLADRVDKVFTDQRVYVSGLIEGRLERGRDGTLEVRPIVSPERAGLLRHSQIHRDIRRARERNDDGTHKLRFTNDVAIDLGTSERTWSSSDKDVEARKTYERTRRRKGKFATKGRAAKKKKKKSSKSISAMLERLLTSNAERQLQKRRLERQRRARRDAFEDARAD